MWIGAREAHTLADSALPPSRFRPGFTVGDTPVPVPGAPVAADSEPAAGVNRLAVVTFVATLALGLVVAPLTLPLAFVAHRRVAETGHGGAGLAKASMVISGIYLAVGVVVMALYVYRAHTGTGT